MLRRPLLPALLLLAGLMPPRPAVAAGPATKPSADYFPLMAWNGWGNNAATFKKIRECGLTVAGFVTPDGLDACHAAGLKAIVSEPRLTALNWAKLDPAEAKKVATEVVDKHKAHPAVIGYYLRDEPDAGLFPGLAVAANVVKERHPGAWPYINLFPNYAEPWQMKTPNYEAYLDKFVEVCRPPVLSYDHYALLEGNGFSEAYYTNLEQMRRAAVKNDVPFWNIVQAEACLNFREPTAVDFRFQVYTSLAYGARGIAYFQYMASTTGNFRGAPIDAFGNETASWNWMRQVNLQVGQLAPTLLKLKSDGAYHIGGTVPPGCAGPGEKSLVKAVGGTILVGDFTHADGSRYVMCVNKSFTGSVPCFPQFREPVKKVEKVSPYNGGLSDFSGEDVWLAPGQGVLLKLTR